MYDDGVGGLGALGTFRQALARAPLFGVSGSRLIGGLAERQALHADAEAGAVHHGEHATQAFMRLADEIALGLVEIEYAGGRAVNAHLLFDRAAGDAIARAEFSACAVAFDVEFGYQKKRNAAHARRCIGQFSEHKMDNVIRQIMLAGGDENLAAADAIHAFTVRRRLRTNQTKIGAALTFG